jgi:hypothetical protein
MQHVMSVTLTCFLRLVTSRRGATTRNGSTWSGPVQTADGASDAVRSWRYRPRAMTLQPAPARYDRDRDTLAAVLRLISGTRSYAAAVTNERLTELGITLPSIAPPVGNYVGCVIVDRTACVGGHGDVCRPTQAAVVMAELPFGIAVKIEMIARVRD